MYIRVGGWVPPTAAPFPLKWMLSWLVLLYFVMHFLAPPDFHVRARANVYVSMYIRICLCVCGGGGGGGGLHMCACLCASALSCNGSESTGLESTSLTFQISAKFVV